MDWTELRVNPPSALCNIHCLADEDVWLRYQEQISEITNKTYFVLILVLVTHIQISDWEYIRMDTLFPECSVCSVQGVATGKHYVAVTCYSCRAFFRRIPEQKQSPRCKFHFACPVSDGEKRQCDGCRFQKCIK